MNGESGFALSENPINQAKTTTKTFNNSSN